jgi:hypothetical protein
MPAIEAAYRGRHTMLEAIFGSSKPKPKSIDYGPSLFKDLKRMALANKRRQGRVTNG